VLVVFLEGGTNPEARAKDLEAQLEAGGITEVGVFRVGDYANATFPALQPTDEAWVVYVGVKDNRADLMDCSEVKKVKLRDAGPSLSETCWEVQPEPQ
jgi:hypothetical protein